MLAASKGLSIHVLVNEKGITEKIESIDEIFNTVALRTGKPKSIVKSFLGDYISDDAIKDNLNRLFSTVAFKEVTLGQNWGSTVTLTSKAPINVNNLYTLTNLRSDSAFIDIRSKILAGNNGRFYLTGEQNGTVILNYKTGIPYKYETLSQTVINTTSYDVQEIEHFLAIFNTAAKIAK